MERNKELEILLDKQHENIEPSKELLEFIHHYTSSPWLYYVAGLDIIIKEHPEMKKYILEKVCSFEEENIIKYEPMKIDPYKKELEILDIEMDMYKLPIDVTTYRGTTEAYFGDLTIRNGDEYEFLPHYSTSIYLDIARQHLKENKPLLLELHLPKDYNALWVSPYSFYQEEGEIILGSNKKFRLIKEDFSNLAYYPKVKRMIFEPIIK